MGAGRVEEDDELRELAREPVERFAVGLVFAEEVEDLAGDFRPVDLGLELDGGHGGTAGLWCSMKRSSAATRAAFWLLPLLRHASLKASSLLCLMAMQS